MSSSVLIKRTIPWALILIVALVTASSQYVTEPTNILSTVSGKFTLWSGLIVAFTFIFALVVTSIHNYRTIVRKGLGMDKYLGILFFVIVIATIGS